MGIIDRLLLRKPPTAVQGESGRGNAREPKGGIGSRLRTGQLNPDEFNAKLQLHAGYTVFDQMWRSDPDVRKTLLMLVNPIVNGTYIIEPYGGEDASEKSIEQAQFVSWALLEEFAWKAHLWALMRVGGRYGNAPFEHVYKQASWKGRDVIILKSLGLRLPLSIWSWDIDGDDLVSFTQTTATRGEVTLARPDISYYRFGAEGDNWEGESLLRGAYKPWKYKDTLEVVEAIALERFRVGLPVVFPPAGAATAELEAVQQALRNIRANEQGHLIMPGPEAKTAGDGGWTFRIEVPDSGEGSALQDAISAHRDGISANMIQEFMRLGQSGTGARATADVQQDPFLAYSEAIASLVIEDEANATYVRRLVALNWPEAEIEGFPTLKCSLIDSTSLVDLQTYVSGLITSGALHPDDVLEDYVRDKGDLPPADPEQRKLRKEQEEQQAQAEQDALQAGTDHTRAQAEATLNPPAKPELRAIPGGKDKKTLSQGPHADFIARHFQLDAVEGTLDRAKDEMRTAVAPFLPTIAHAAVNGVEPDLEPLTAAIEATLADIWRAGAESVMAELRSQGAPLALAASSPDDPELSDRAEQVAAGVLSAVMRVVRLLKMRGGGTQGSTLAKAEQAGAAAAGQAAVDHASSVLNDARAATAEDHADEIAGVLYTSILDKNRCEQCKLADDGVIRQLDDPVRLHRMPPNPDCYGGTRCRCMEIYVFKGEQSVTTLDISTLNWVSETGGLPHEIHKLAKKLQREHGMDESRAIATAVAAAKRFAAKGHAKWQAAVADWERKRSQAHALAWREDQHVRDRQGRFADMPFDATTLTHVGSLGGSTGARLVEDQAGQRFVAKRGAHADHLAEEDAADRAYRAAGVDVPASRVEGGTKYAEFVSGTLLRDLHGPERAAAEQRLREHFVLDAVLGNWDVIGLAKDNVLVRHDGTPVRIDNGGSLRFRAQGQPKTGSNDLIELDTMRERGVAAEVFGSLTDAEVRQQAEDLLAKRADILQAVDPPHRAWLEPRFAQLADWVRTHEPATTLAQDLFMLAKLNPGYGKNWNPADHPRDANGRFRVALTGTAAGFLEHAIKGLGDNPHEGIEAPSLMQALRHKEVKAKGTGHQHVIHLDKEGGKQLEDLAAMLKKTKVAKTKVEQRGVHAAWSDAQKVQQAADYHSGATTPGSSFAPVLEHAAKAEQVAAEMPTSDSMKTEKAASLISEALADNPDTVEWLLKVIDPDALKGLRFKLPSGISYEITGKQGSSIKFHALNSDGTPGTAFSRSPKAVAGYIKKGGGVHVAPGNEPKASTPDKGAFINAVAAAQTGAAGKHSELLGMIQKDPTIAEGASINFHGSVFDVGPYDPHTDTYAVTRQDTGHTDNWTPQGLANALSEHASVITVKDAPSAPDGNTIGPKLQAVHDAIVAGDKAKTQALLKEAGDEIVGMKFSKGGATSYTVTKIDGNVVHITSSKGDPYTTYYSTMAKNLVEQDGLLDWPGGKLSGPSASVPEAKPKIDTAKKNAYQVLAGAAGPQAVVTLGSMLAEPGAIDHIVGTQWTSPTGSVYEVTGGNGGAVSYTRNGQPKDPVSADQLAKWLGGSPKVTWNFDGTTTQPVAAPKPPAPKPKQLPGMNSSQSALHADTPLADWLQSGDVEHSHGAFDHLGSAEFASKKPAWKKAMNHYTASGYGPMNDAKRGKGIHSQEVWDDILALEELIREAPTPSKSVILHRGVTGKKGDEWQAAQVGHVVVDNGFSSTSPLIDKAWSAPTQLHILAPPGTPMLDVTHGSYSTEMEVLLHPNNRMKVLARKKDAHGTVHLYVEAMPLT